MAFVKSSRKNAGASPRFTFADISIHVLQQRFTIVARFGGSAEFSDESSKNLRGVLHVAQRAVLVVRVVHRHFTEANQGKAFYTGLKGLGEMIFEDYETNRKKKIK